MPLLTILGKTLGRHVKGVGFSRKAILVLVTSIAFIDISLLSLIYLMLINNEHLKIHNRKHLFVL